MLFAIHIKFEEEKCQKWLWTREKFFAQKQKSRRKTVELICWRNILAYAAPIGCRCVENFHFDTLIVAVVTSSRSPRTKLKFFDFFGLRRPSLCQGHTFSWFACSSYFSAFCCIYSFYLDAGKFDISWLVQCSSILGECFEHAATTVLLLFDKLSFVLQL